MFCSEHTAGQCLSSLLPWTCDHWGRWWNIQEQFSSVLLQFLYATYIAPSAAMDIGLQQSKKTMIYQKIDPAFEDLFDPAEEYVLTVLLEPWMKMMEADKHTYGKVIVLDDTMSKSCQG